MRLLVQYDWPGNVRELENCIERQVVLAEEEAVTLKTIPSPIATYFNDIQQVTPCLPAPAPVRLSGRWRGRSVRRSARRSIVAAGYKRVRHASLE